MDYLSGLQLNVVHCLSFQLSGFKTDFLGKGLVLHN